MASEVRKRTTQQVSSLSHSAVFKSDYVVDSHFKSDYVVDSH